MSKDDKAVAKRDEHGRFIKGQSGNPAGRQKGSRNHIVRLRETTEHALRDYLASPSNQKRAMAALDRIFRIAEQGEDKEALQAMKLLFDKVLPQARGGNEDAEGMKQRPIAIQIVNQTSDTATSPITVVDVDEE